MKMAKRIMKIVLLIFGLIPYITFILLLAIVGNGKYTKDVDFLTLGWLSIFSIPVQWIFYIANVFRNNTIAKNQKVLWVVLLFLGSLFVFPIYWYLHIWKDVSKIQNRQNKYTFENISTQRENRGFKGKKHKITFFIAGILPIIFGILTIIIRLNEPANKLFYVFGWLTYISLISLIVLYILNVSKNDSVTKNNRLLWIVLIIVGNVIIFPFYWFRHIFHETKESLNN